MQLAIVLTALTLWMCRVFSARQAAAPGNDCPAKVAVNSKNECIGTQLWTRVPSDCCHELRWCSQQIQRLSDAYAERIVAFHEICKLQQEDVGKDQDGKHYAVDNTRLCASKCTETCDLDKPLPSAELLKSSCADHEKMDTVRERESLVNALDLARKSCAEAASSIDSKAAASSSSSSSTTATTTTTTAATTTETTTTETTTTTTTTTATTSTSTTATTYTTWTYTTRTRTTTTTTKDYLNFTDYFLQYQGDDKAAGMPNGKRYLCCCRPDKPSNTVQCVLKSKDIESHAERVRRLLYSGCGGAMGGDYVSWNNVWWNSEGDWRHEFDGELVGGSFIRMRHRGQCVAMRGGLPEDIYATYLKGLFGALVTQ